MKVVVSSCLLGNRCKYNGKDNYNEELVALLNEHTVIPLCPEVLGSLPIPRECCEIVDGVVRTKDGESKDQAYCTGAKKALNIALQQGAELAILQARSPSCGFSHIYDGTFSHRLIEGKGIFARELEQAKIRSFDTEQMEEIRAILGKEKNKCKKIEIE